jgi:phosphate transport system protein
MSTTQLPQHISQQFDRELEDIRSRVLAMGGLVEEQLTMALDAMSQGNSDLAESVATSDYKVNALEVAIDEECTEILARRQPAASDLRLVLAVIKIIADLERIGDEASKIGRLVLRLIESESPKSYYINVLAMGNHVKRTLNGALDAFARMDSRSALNIAREDPKVDQEYDATLRQLITYMMEDPRNITPVLNVIWAVRALERIGDHANNVCESVIYLVEGKDIRHTNYDDVEKELEELRRNP